MELVHEVVLEEGSSLEGWEVWQWSELMVCNCIMVYTKNLKYVRQISFDGASDSSVVILKSLQIDMAIFISLIMTSLIFVSSVTMVHFYAHLTKMETV